jgi:hypothetical protein
MRLAHVSLALVSLLPAFPQNHTLDTQKSADLLNAAAKDGVALFAKTAVRESVGVTAVLLTTPAVRRLFGRDIADTYAVIQLTISNKSADAAFVIHSAYIDTSQWALGGDSAGFREGARQDNPGDSASQANRVSSVESRIARGQLLDAQQWSARNGAYRWRST